MSNSSPEERLPAPGGRLNGFYDTLKLQTADQVDGAVSLVSRLATLLRLRRAVHCPRCGREIGSTLQYRRVRVCPACGHHFSLDARTRIRLLADPRSFAPLVRKREAVIAGAGCIEQQPVVLIAFDFQFLGGTMSRAAGEMIAHAFEYAGANQLAVVAIVASGGVRIQQGMAALLQMAKTTQTVLDYQKVRRPFIAVLTNPTTGGVYASFVSLADIVLAEPGALIGFAGPRVAQAATGEQLPAKSHTAESALENGMIDALVPRPELRERIGRLVALSTSATPPKAPTVRPPQKLRGANAREVIELARHPERPTSRDYIARAFSDFVELHGDRLQGDDPRIIGGLARLETEPLVIIAQQRARGDKRERGAGASGYRKAERLIHLAERFSLPIVTLVDTPGADPGYESERYGVAGAIAHCLAALVRVPVPTLAVIIGEGTSGGALALAATDRVLMQENATYAVISPEGASAILFGDASHAAETVNRLRVTAHDLLPRQIVDRAVLEPKGGAHLDVDCAAAELRAELQAGLAELQAQSEADRLAARRKRYRRVGLDS